MNTHIYCQIHEQYEPLSFTCDEIYVDLKTLLTVNPNIGE